MHSHCNLLLQANDLRAVCAVLCCASALLWQSGGLLIARPLRAVSCLTWPLQPAALGT